MNLLKQVLYPVQGGVCVFFKVAVNSPPTALTIHPPTPLSCQYTSITLLYYHLLSISLCCSLSVNPVALDKSVC